MCSSSSKTDILWHPLAVVKSWSWLARNGEENLGKQLQSVDVPGRYIGLKRERVRELEWCLTVLPHHFQNTLPHAGYHMGQSRQHSVIYCNTDSLFSSTAVQLILETIKHMCRVLNPEILHNKATFWSSKSQPSKIISRHVTNLATFQVGSYFNIPHQPVAYSLPFSHPLFQGRGALIKITVKLWLCSIQKGCWKSQLSKQKQNPWAIQLLSSQFSHTKRYRCPQKKIIPEKAYTDLSY